MSNVASVTSHFPTANEGFITTLLSTIIASATVVPLTTTSGLANGSVFVGIIEPGGTKQQVFTGTVDTSGNQITNVVWTRGTDVGHNAGSSVVDYVSGTYINMITKGIGVSHSQDGKIKPSALELARPGAWSTDSSTLPTPDTITYNGNNSYDFVFNGADRTNLISEGMRLRGTRSAPAPTQSTSLNGTTQYWSKTSPNKMTFTDDFTLLISGLYLTSYPAVGSASLIVSRWNGASGWYLNIAPSGQVELVATNGGAVNYSRVVTTQSVPLNKEFSIVAQLDMSSFTATPTTSYIMMDGKDVSCIVTRSGTNPTALVQAGDLQIGAGNSIYFHSGYIAQVGIFNAKVTQATAITYLSQGLTGSEANLASAYSFNGVATDMNTTTPNDLTAVASAGYVTASPFGNNGKSSTLEYGLVMKTVYSGGNTTLTVQAPAGCKFPTTGGLSALAYSTAKAPYGWPTSAYNWEQTLNILSIVSTSGTATGTVYNPGGVSMTLSTGSWKIVADIGHQIISSVTGYDYYVAISTNSTSLVSNKNMIFRKFINGLSSNPTMIDNVSFVSSVDNTTSTPYYLLMSSANAFTTMAIRGASFGTNNGEQTYITATPAGL